MLSSKESPDEPHNKGLGSTMSGWLTMAKTDLTKSTKQYWQYIEHMQMRYISTAGQSTGGILNPLGSYGYGDSRWSQQLLQQELVAEQSGHYKHKPNYVVDASHYS